MVSKGSVSNSVGAVDDVPKERWSRAGEFMLPKARGNIFYFESDLIVEPGALDTSARLDGGARGRRVSPAHNPDGTDQESCHQLPNPLIRFYVLTRQALVFRVACLLLWMGLDKTQARFGLGVRCGYATGRDTRKIGLFDERFFLEEDADVCRRVWPGQRVVYTPLRAYHYYQRQAKPKPWQAHKQYSYRGDSATTNI